MRRMIEPKTGELWEVNFDPQVGREQGGLRPALIVSNNWFNETQNGLYVVIPITGTDRGHWYHVKLLPPEGNLTKPSFIMCEQVRSQSEDRFVRRRGKVTNSRLGQVQDLIARLF